MATRFLILVAVAAWIAVPASAQTPERPRAVMPEPGQWRGLHIKAPTHQGVANAVRLCRNVRRLGINVLVAEVNYRFRFQSHPELSEGDLTAEDARVLVTGCRAEGVQVVPQFQFLGHQSWGAKRNALLAHNPDMDESQGLHGIRSRSWCPLHPGVNPIVFALLDELLGAFDAPAMHVGMDEVTEIARCPRCAGSDPAVLFARAVRDVHAHLTSRGVRTLMWADGLLNRSAGMGADASDTGMHAAIDDVPKDVVLCDWHYHPEPAYPSVDYLVARGFQVWLSSWRSATAAKGLIAAGLRAGGASVLGMLYTCWNCGRGAPALLRAITGEPGWRTDEAFEVLRVIRMARWPDPAPSTASPAPPGSPSTREADRGEAGGGRGPSMQTPGGGGGS